MIALHIGHVVGLGGGEQHPLDAHAAQQPHEDAAMPIPEAFKDHLDGHARVVECLAASQQRTEDVDQDDLPRIVVEVLVVKRRNNFVLIGFKALLHQRTKRAVG